MSESTGPKRLNAVVKELNVGMQTLVEHLAKKGYSVEAKPTTKLSDEQYSVLLSDFQSDKKNKEESKLFNHNKVKPKDITIDQVKPKTVVVSNDDDYVDDIVVKTGLTNRYEKPIEPKSVKPIEKPIEKVIDPIVITPAPVKEEVKEIVVVETPKIEPKPEKVKVEKAPKVEEIAEKTIETPINDVDSDSPKLTILGKIDLNAINSKTRPDKRVKEKKEIEKPAVKKAPAKSVKVETEIVEEVKKPIAKTEKNIPETEIVAVKEVVPVEKEIVDVIAPQMTEPNYEKLTGLKVMGKIVLPVDLPKSSNKPIASSDVNNKKKRKRTNYIGGSDTTNDKLNKYTKPADGTARPPYQGNNAAGTPRTPYQGNNPNGPRTPYQGNNPAGGAGTPRTPYQGNNPNGPRTPYQGNNPAGGGARPPFNRNAAGGNKFGSSPAYKPGEKKEITDKEVQDKLKATLARLNPGSKNPNIGAVRSKIRKQKRDDARSEREEAAIELENANKVLKVTEFVTANELSKMMEVTITQIISTCMSLGMMVSINQRLDAETISIVAEEFGFEVDFVSAEVQEAVEEDKDDPADLVTRAPIVTVMGHVDHGKTSLLDYIRKANVIAGEAGGITQHVGAYEVTLDNGKKIAFLDTPGHEAFTAMRARGAKITDIVIIVIAADDSVMPQTKEAISHAQAAGVPIVFAFNKIDKDGANVERIREQLAQMNILVEEWGGKYQTQEISAKKGLNIDLLLDKVLLEAEILDLKANPNRRAVGSIIEASLDKGRGIVATLMVQNGTLRVGDPIIAGTNSGKVKAMFDERGKKMLFAGPSTPAVVLGFDGAPQAGDKLIITKTEQEAREISNKRKQLQREQGLRTNKHITLDEIGRRLAIGNFKELKIIVKGDVDGSVEALSDSLIKLSTEEVQVSVIYKAVGQISESDVMLASASDAIIIGFQVRPSPQARKLAEAESIDVRMYSIIYNAINEIKLAIEGMHTPKMEEKITGNIEIREVFKITKVGAVAGCMVTDGKVFRNSKIRLIRDGVVMHTGELSSLKRFKDDVKEVAYGFDCGLTIEKFNDMRVGDYVEAYEEVEIKRIASKQ
ncbi:MAG: translation initiation factor IF-2 [Bacteroidia bacterium]|nr:translation initiation factor IF-2 [Bacteroidia bacterium]